jgi:hypothetical protein
MWRDYGILVHTTFVFSKSSALLLLLLEPTLSLVRVADANLVWNPDSDIRLQLE